MGYLPTRFYAGAPVSPPLEERFFSFLGGRAAPVAIALSLLAGCGTTADRRPVDDIVVDDAGRAVPVGAPAHRVVSTLPSVTELIVALDATDRLIARTGYDDASRLAHLPSLGRTLSPSAEVLAALGPDLIITGRDRRGAPRVEQLESLGASVYVADVQGVADIYSTAERVGRLLGLSGRADSLVAGLRSGLDRARDRYAADPRPTVLYVVWHDPPLTTGSGTFIDELITIAGGANVFADVGASWPAVSLEEIVRRDPDYIVIPRGTGHSIQPDWLDELPGWRGLSAVRENRVVSVDSDLFNRPGPRVVEAAHTLGRALRSVAGEGRR